MADTTVVLGSVTFADFEVPQSIPFGGDQQLAVHDMPGGVRVIDSMGAFEAPIPWSGIFTGTDALDRALALDALRQSGAVQTLTWGKLRFQVVVGSFHAEYQRFYRIPYRISCEVQTNQTAAVPTQPNAPAEQIINTDAAQATDLADTVGDSTLSGLIDDMNSAIGAVSSFATAARSVINTVSQPIAAAISQVGTLIATATAAIGTPTTFAGIVVGGNAVGAAVALSTQTADMGTLTTLLTLNGVLGRLAANVVSTNSSPNTITVAGGNLYQIAEEQYGDATAWTAIANANGLTDPFISGPMTLTIPLQSDQSGGVLNS